MGKYIFQYKDESGNWKSIAKFSNLDQALNEGKKWQEGKWRVIEETILEPKWKRIWNWFVAWLIGIVVGIIIWILFFL